MTRFSIWTSDLSPFCLKTYACLEFAGHTYRKVPQECGRISALVYAHRVRNAKAKGTISRYPQMSELDEYPLVPILIDTDRSMQFDSSAIAHWLDSLESSQRKLWPEDQKLRVVAQIVDDAFDEFALYLAHHQRWSVSAAVTDAAKRLYGEFGHIPFLPSREKFVRTFEARQVRRLPYMMSVAPENFGAELPEHLRPVYIEGWPDTHRFLEEAWGRYIEALDYLFNNESWILGGSFTAADASVYGSLGALLYDETSRKEMESRAPALVEWLRRVGRGDKLEGNNVLRLPNSLAELLGVINETFIPLMIQNKAAWLQHRANGETVFNERGMRLGKSLYDGELLGHRFRMVAKTFQVRVWDDIVAALNDLESNDRDELISMMPGLSEV